ncbi:hypothetical protein BKA59DRAFT_390322 [Fusarium tricinctum]|uniref:Forkhead box protein O n=1 Tax=Fusarium tricinctum TaxID=61284 RepID=A0A8K0S2D6_9HYPO|nr:hypothetical protein BKA59DRAFT_390322 [Fusarium tricinctum]
MDPPFPGDGQPSSYTNTLPGHGQQSPCVPELTGMGSYYALSSGPQDQPPHLSSTGPLPLGLTLSQHQDNQQRSHPTQDATAYTSMSSGFHYPPRSHHQVWPSPPPGPDDYDNYSYQSSPSSGSAPMSCYNPSPISPRTWSSPDFPLSQASESLHQQSQQNPYHNLRICTPTSTEGLPVRGSQVLTPFSGGCMNQGFDNEIDGMPHNYSPVTIPSSSVGALSCTSSPQEPLLSTPMHMETRQESPAGEPDYRAGTDEQLDAKDGKGAVVGVKTEEPYAKLLYRALMSAPDHAMTLQEIYQWFRENTDKDVKKENTPKRPGKNAEGWQNSIRHNLSMNEAFIKRGSKQASGCKSNAGDQDSGPGPAKAGEPKKPTEWMLEDWAVQNGVESTTKYRPKHPPRRAVGSRVHHHPYDHKFLQHGSPISPTGAAGRKGDCPSTKLRMRGRQYAHETNMPPTSHHINIMAHPHPTRRTTAMPSMYQSHHQQQLGYEDMMMPRIEAMSQTAIKQDYSPIKQEYSPMAQTAIKQEYSPMTPDSSAFGFVLPEPSLIHAHAVNSSASASVSNVNGNANVDVNGNGPTAYALLSGGHQAQSMYVGSSPCEYPYGMVDVTGVYQGAGHNTVSGGVNERLIGIGPNAVYNWNGQAL